MAKPATNIKKTSDFILAEYAQILAIIYDRERFRNGIIDCISKAKKATDSDEDNQLADQKTNELYESWYPANLSKIFFASLHSQNKAIETIKDFQEKLLKIGIIPPIPPSEITNLL